MRPGRSSVWIWPIAGRSLCTCLRLGCTAASLGCTARPIDCTAWPLDSTSVSSVSGDVSAPFTVCCSSCPPLFSSLCFFWSFSFWPLPPGFWPLARPLRRGRLGWNGAGGATPTFKRTVSLLKYFDTIEKYYFLISKLSIKMCSITHRSLWYDTKKFLILPPFSIFIFLI